MFRYKFWIPVAEAALLGLVWAVALKLNIPAMVIGCAVSIMLLQLLLPFVLTRSATAGCGMLLGGWFVILMIAGLVTWLIRAIAC